MSLRSLGSGERDWLERITGGHITNRDRATVSMQLRLNNEVQRRQFEELEELVKAAQEEIKRGMVREVSVAAVLRLCSAWRRSSFAYYGHDRTIRLSEYVQTLLDSGAPKGSSFSCRRY